MRTEPQPLPAVNIVSAVMWQHRCMQRLHGVIEARPHDVEGIAALGKAVVDHATSTERVLSRVEDPRVVKDLAAHVAHHTALRLQLFRIATSSSEQRSVERARFVSLTREHALHEATLLGALLLAVDEGQLQVLGEQLTWSSP
jgi:hypothetical protein